MDDSMCYYEQFVYQCGDWKWGNFRQHCQKEYRMGETCGMKLVYTSSAKEERCTLCERIDRKVRRYEKHQSDMNRWAKEPSKYSATIEKTQRDMSGLATEIKQLRQEKEEKNKNVGNLRRR